MSIPRRLTVPAILTLALALRVWGIGFGLPHPLSRPDEEAVMTVALRFFRRQGNPGFFDWPSLFMYAVCVIYIAFFNIGRMSGWFRYEADLATAASINPGKFYLMARALGAAMGVITVGAAYQVGRILFDRTTALSGALFLAVAALHVRDSHFGVADVAATCLVTLSFVATARYAAGGRRRDAVISAVWAGMATSTKYNAVLIALPGVWALWRTSGPGATGRSRWRLAAMYVAIVGLVFFAGTPYALIDWPHFIRSLHDISAHLQGGHVVMGNAWMAHLSSSLWYGMGLPMLAMSIAGLIWYARCSPSAGALYAIFPVTYLVGIGSGRTAFARYALPVIPFLCLAAAYATVNLARSITASLGRTEWMPSATAVLVGLIALPSVRSAIATDRLLARTDTRVVAADWLRSNVPSTATVYQSGSGYVHLQLKTPPLETFPELTWDEGLNGFRDASSRPSENPAIIVIPECPLAYCDVPRSLQAVIKRWYRPLRRFEGHDPAAGRLIYDREDAFLLPLAGFGAVDRPGPNVTIYSLR
jgi:hypothetical protein